jgi:peptidoglycan/LPS O-acetylase OafA/YrhL
MSKLALKDMSATDGSLQYLPELNALRALAVVMTLLAHFAPVEIPYMWYGVPIFFTLSGFLITTILIRNQEKNEKRLVIIKNFVIRRVLRLFPVYYLFLLFFLLAKKFLGLYLWKDDYTLYFFTYTPNLLIAKMGAHYLGCFEHLWSLGVEEQFYLFWPWLLLFSPPKFRIPIIAVMICIPFVSIYIDPQGAKNGVFPFHTLGVGAILACLYVRKDAAINWLKQNRSWIFGLTFLHLLVVLFLFDDRYKWWYIYREVSLCLCTFSIVLVSIFGWRGVVGYITRNKQVQYIGVISYGIYLFHMPVPFVYRAIAARAFPSVHLSPLVFMFLCFAITFTLAALSYRFIETPFLKMKRLFV